MVAAKARLVLAAAARRLGALFFSFFLCTARSDNRELDACARSLALVLTSELSPSPLSTQSDDAMRYRRIRLDPDLCFSDRILAARSSSEINYEI